MKSRKSRVLSHAGKTTEGLSVLDGVGYACFSRGVPLEIVLEYFKSKNLVVDWCDYIDTAIKDGHSHRTIYAKIQSAVSEVYGRKYSEQVMIRTEQYLTYIGEL
jgi:hypothetical protein